MNHEEIIKALKEVPGVRLRLIELCWELYQNGELNEAKAAFLRKEIAEAVKEAESYAQATREAVWALRELAH